MNSESRLAVLLMRYPSQTEVFADRDIGELSKHYDVDVISYFSGNGLSGASWRPSLCTALLETARSLDKFFYIIFLMLKKRETGVRDFLKTLVLTPLSISIFNRLVEQKVDAVHLFWGHYPSITGLLVKRYSKIAVTSFLGAYDLEQRFWGTLELSGMGVKYVTHCNYNIELLRLYYGIKADRVSVVYRSLDVNSFYKLREDKNTHKYLNIAFTGKCCAEKGVFDVLEVARELKRLKVNFRMNFIGGGPALKRLITLSEKHGLNDFICFHGWTRPEDVRNILWDADVFLMLSKKRSERLPNAVKEAMLAGCYVISSKTNGIEELVPKGGGMIFSDDSFDGIPRHIIQCAEN